MLVSTCFLHHFINFVLDIQAHMCCASIIDQLANRRMKRSIGKLAEPKLGVPLNGVLGRALVIGSDNANCTTLTGVGAASDRNFDIQSGHCSAPCCAARTVLAGPAALSTANRPPHTKNRCAGIRYAPKPDRRVHPLPTRGPQHQN